MYKEKLTVEQSAEHTSRILVYEIGDVIKCMVYMDRHGETGYVGETKLALSDSLSMFFLLVEQLGYDIDEIKQMGYDRFCEAMGNLSRGHR